MGGWSPFNAKDISNDIEKLHHNQEADLGTSIYEDFKYVLFQVLWVIVFSMYYFYESGGSRGPTSMSTE